MNLVHSKGKPGASFPTTSINVRFVADEPLNLQINHAMKTSLQENPVHPALFRIAAIVGNPITPINGNPAPSAIKKEFATFRREIAKSMAARTVRTQPKTPVTETCGWTFPIR